MDIIKNINQNIKLALLINRHKFGFYNKEGYMRIETIRLSKKVQTHKSFIPKPRFMLDVNKDFQSMTLKQKIEYFNQNNIRGEALIQFLEAIEPKTAKEFKSNPYLMDILTNE